MVEDIAPETVNEKLENGDDLQVVDIRRPPQFARGHIPGAENVPFPELPQRVDEHDWGDEIVVACPVGQSSQKAARMLESYEGVDEDARVLNLEGGYRAWEFDLEEA
jgi:rhodanese-related sulfurtransferase